MQKILILTTVVVLLSLLLGACGSVGIDIQPPADSSGDGGTQALPQNFFLYVLVGLAILIGLLALVRK